MTKINITSYIILDIVNIIYMLYHCFMLSLISLLCQPVLSRLSSKFN